MTTSIPAIHPPSVAFRSRPLSHIPVLPESISNAYGPTDLPPTETAATSSTTSSSVRNAIAPWPPAVVNPSFPPDAMQPDSHQRSFTSLTGVQLGHAPLAAHYAFPNQLDAHHLDADLDSTHVIPDDCSGLLDQSSPQDCRAICAHNDRLRSSTTTITQLHSFARVPTFLPRTITFDTFAFPAHSRVFNRQYIGIEVIERCRGHMLDAEPARFESGDHGHDGTKEDGC
ncbi:hypothetical protein BCR44DRAFT_178800 [Catenaria anguillulae PL171]|uniref:Uncharacterized protein n=1 Tax=Catenaria anguillulae PL171 TaxID=765915 RepID=A0A1Y2H7Z1_9FUNG|nr:hypothetical protein BCR44DRAFT_178800 [Catenaria anguillulae PL171]